MYKNKKTGSNEPVLNIPNDIFFEELFLPFIYSTHLVICIAEIQN